MPSTTTAKTTTASTKKVTPKVMPPVSVDNSTTDLAAAQAEIAALKAQVEEMSAVAEEDTGPPTLAELVAQCSTTEEGLTLLANHIERQTDRMDLVVLLFKRLWGHGPMEDFGLY